MAVTRRRPRIAEPARDERGVMNVRQRFHDDEQGQTVVNVVVLVIVLGAALLSAYLLARTMDAAQSINVKADTIAETGRGINLATDSVVQLSRVNRSAVSINETAKPLDEQLARIVDEAKRINTLAVSINGSAQQINGTATTINNTGGTINSTAGTINQSATSIRTSAGGINATAAQILDVAQRIDTDVRLINENLDVTIGIARAIEGDTTNILGQAIEAHDTACGIDDEAHLVIGGPADAHC